MDNIKVAVFPAGSEIGLEICNALKFEKYIELFGLTSVPDHSQMVFGRLCYVPFYTDEHFIQKLNAVLEENEINYIYPAYDDILLFLTERQAEIKAKIITSPLKTIEITRSKRKTYEYLREEDFIPKVYHSAEEIKEYPVFAKPDIGQASQGVKKITSKEELIFEEYGKEVVVSEYLPGEELTVDCFTDKDGNLLSYIPRKRLRIRNGIAVRSELVESTEEIARIAIRLNQCFVFKGAWFFQIKKDVRGAYKLLEIAARIPGTMGLTRNLGINYPMLMLYVNMDIPVSVRRNHYNLVVDRALISRYELDIKYQHVYIDLDDTLIIKGRVNVLLVQYLYQCINDKKSIYLLTRHKGDVTEYLESFKIPGIIFNEIIVIGEQPKSQFIKQKDAIFIDDSYRERINVQEVCEISAFGTDNIESLICWK